MFRKYGKAALLGLCLSISSVSVWAKSKPADSVVFSIKPVALIYAALTEQTVKPEQVIYSARLNMHDYQLSVQDLKKIDKAERVYWLGPEVEQSLARLKPRFTSQHWQALLAPAAYQKNQEHAWLDPVQLRAMIIAMAADLESEHPENATVIANRSERLLAAMSSRIGYWSVHLQPYQQQAFLVGHSAFADFFHALGLRQAKVYSMGHSHGQQALGAKEKLQIQQQIQDGGIRCAFEEPDVSFAGLQKRFPNLQRVELEPMASSQAFDELALLAFIERSAGAIASCIAGSTKVKA